MNIEKDMCVLSTLSLVRDGKIWKQFDIVSNMEAFGINPQEQVNKWLGRKIKRTKKYTAEAFCDFVERRFPQHPELFVVTKGKFDKVCRDANFTPEVAKIIVQENQSN